MTNVTPVLLAASPAARGSVAFVGTLLVRALGLAAGVALALLCAALLWVP